MRRVIHRATRVDGNIIKTAPAYLQASLCCWRYFGIAADTFSCSVVCLAA